MAKSKSGATSSHTIAAGGGCLQHNRRQQIAKNVMPERTYLNESWESDSISSRKQLRGLKERAERLYTERTGQKCQKSFAPYKESCVVIKDNSTLDQAKEFAKKVEEGIPGIKCMGIWIHRDEGFYKSTYVEGDDSFVCNTHAHYLWCCQNPDTGKAIPIKRQDLRNMQDWAADAFGMERGNPAEQTKRNHIPSMEYKMQAMENRLEKMQAAVDQLSTAKEAKESAIEGIKAAKEGVLSLMGKSAHQKEIAGLKTQIDDLKEQHKTEIIQKDKEIEKVQGDLKQVQSRLNSEKYYTGKLETQISTMNKEFCAVLKTLHLSPDSINLLKKTAPVLMKAISFLKNLGDEASL